MATSGQFYWPSVGSSVAAYGQFRMAANTAALVVAKLIKLAERMSGPKPDRILAKDASDVLRMLRYNDAAAIGARLGRFATEDVGSGTIETAVKFLQSQLALRTSPVVELAVECHRLFETGAQITASYRTLAQRLFDAYGGRS